MIDRVIFSGQSHIELQTMRHVEHKTSIYIEFKTHRYDGQLLYTEQVWGTFLILMACYTSLQEYSKVYSLWIKLFMSDCWTHLEAF